MKKWGWALALAAALITARLIDRRDGTGVPSAPPAVPATDSRSNAEPAPSQTDDAVDRARPPTEAKPAAVPLPPARPDDGAAPGGPAPADDRSAQARRALLDHLARDLESSTGTVTIPGIEETLETAYGPLAPPAPTPGDERAARRHERRHLPLGVVLRDGVPALKSPRGDALYRMLTGDFVRVYPESPAGFWRAQPGVDIYLAATSKRFEAAGDRFPDTPVFLRRADVQIFKPQAAIEFTRSTEPVTLGNEPGFSTLAFYERAIENPDPVVHRVVGPRLVELLSVHEDYLAVWSRLLRDHDAMIRAATLSALRRRGVAGNRGIIEDLIRRLAELTATRARGDTEAEVLSILAVLAATDHPRVPAALKSFEGTWRDAQGEAVNDALKGILDSHASRNPPAETTAP